MNNYGQYIYNSHIDENTTTVKAGWYGGGRYYMISADSNLNEITYDLFVTLLFQKKDPVGHTCPSCAKVCKNLTVYGVCCMWEPIEGIVSSRWG
jgi:hypothetical protein